MILTYPLFLIGLAAVAIPIIIHLLQLRRYRKVYFSNVEMLEELQNEDRKQRNLRRLLILAARIMAIVCIVLAFCQPVIRSAQSGMRAGGTAVSVYVDNSFSMESGGVDGSLLETARRKAREIAAAYKPGDRFQLMTNDVQGGQFRWLSREEFLLAVDGLEVSGVTAMLSTMAQRQNDFLQTAHAANRHAYVLSDFQCATADVQNYPVDSTVLTTLIPLGGSGLANVYVDSLAFNSPAYFKGATVRVEATVTNDGDKAVERLPLRLWVGGRQRAVATVDVGAHSSATAEMTFTVDEQGVLQGYVETTDYPVVFDDKLYFSLMSSTSVPMLAISGQGENVYIKKLFGSDSLIDYRHVGAQQIDYSRLEQNRFIVLDQLHAIPSGMAQTLTSWINEGGSLLVVPGNDAESASYNQFLAACQAPQLQQWVTNSTSAAQVQLEHPLYRGVFKGKNEDVEMPTMTGHWRLMSAGGTVAQPIITLPDGSYMLTATPVGSGWLYLFATPLTSQYTDFVQQALFVPTLYNMALYSAPPANPYHLLTATDPIALGAQWPEGVCRIVPAEYLDGSKKEEGVELIPDLRRVGAQSYLQPHGQLNKAGNYLLLAPMGENSDAARGTKGKTVKLHEKTMQVAQGLSFNYSRHESPLEYYDHRELSKLLPVHDDGKITVATTARRSVTEYIKQRSQGRPLWQLFVWLALAALLAETVLLKLEERSVRVPQHE